MRTHTLTRESIAAAALELVDRDGIDALSMRRLADHIGVGTMTLYGYFRSKTELLEALMDAAVSVSDVPALEGSWHERLVLVARGLRTYLEAHPALVQIRAQQRLTRPRQFVATELMTQALLDAGLSRQDAARAFRAVFTYVFGYVAFSPSATADAARREVRSALAGLDPDTYPALSSLPEEAAGAASGALELE
jgi:AcrR family transcriptional regulator